MSRRLTYANVMATVAVFIALGGSSYAALALEKDSVKSSTIKNGHVRTVDLSRGAVTTEKVSDGTLNAADFASGQLLVGPKGDTGARGLPGADGSQGPQGDPGTVGPTGPKGDIGLTGDKGDKGDVGLTGPKGDKGDIGLTGPKGDKGDPGPFPDGNLPGGKTIRGTYALIEQSSGSAADSISFGFTLASEPIPHLVLASTTPPTECPGTVANPQAAPGHLCIYEQAGTANATRQVLNPATGAINGSSRFGAALLWFGGTNLFSRGTWAVTSPVG